MALQFGFGRKPVLTPSCVLKQPTVMFAKVLVVTAANTNAKAALPPR